MTSSPSRRSRSRRGPPARHTLTTEEAGDASPAPHVKNQRSSADDANAETPREKTRFCFTT